MGGLIAQIQPVPHAADGDDAYARGLFDLLTQPPDVRIEGAGIPEVILAPDLAEEALAPYHLALMTQEQVQEGELLGGQGHRGAGDLAIVTAQVHRQPPGDQAFLAPRLGQNRFQDVSDVLAAIGARFHDLADILPLDDVAGAGAPTKERANRVPQDIIAAILQPMQGAGVYKQLASLP